MRAGVVSWLGQAISCDARKGGLDSAAGSGTMGRREDDLEADRQVANTLAELIIGRALASTEIGQDEGDETDKGAAA